MDRLESMRVFVAVAEEEGFAAGARRLRLSPPAVTRAVASLEASLGVRLLERTTRLVRATEAGQRYLEDARRILAEVRAADEAAAGLDAEPRGHLAVTAPMLFGQMFVVPGIVEFLRRHPQAEVSALLVDRVVNLAEEGVDVAVRIGELADSSLHARPAGSVRVVTCASPDYLARAGTPKAPGDLPGHSLVAVASGGMGGAGAIHWKFPVEGTLRPVRLRPRLVVNTNDGAIAAMLEGHGVGRVLSYQVARHVAEGRLKVVLRKYEPAPWPIHVMHREGRYATARVRAFVELLVGRLRADPALRA